MYVCICNAVTDRQLRDAAERGATTVKHLNRALGLAGKCGKCAAFAQEILTAAVADSASKNSCSGMTFARGA